MIDNYVAILDIGTTKIVSLVGVSKADGEIQILGYGEEKSQGVVRGLVQNIPEATEAIKSATDKAKRQSNIDFKHVYIGIAGQHIYSNFNEHSIVIDETTAREITNIDKKRLIDAVHNIALNPGEKALHVFPLSYQVDGNKLDNPVGTIGRQLSGSFHITVAQKNSLLAIEKSIDRAGLSIIQTILEPIASAESVLTEEEKEAGVALIDIGGGTTDLAIFYKGKVKYTAIIPIGGTIITKDIAEGCNILERQAEEIKTQNGIAIADLADKQQNITVPGIGGRDSREISLRTVAEIIQARIIELIDTVMLEIKTADIKLSAGITLTGGGALQKNIAELAEFRTGYGTRIAAPQNYVYSDTKLFDNPKYATTVGLLQMGNRHHSGWLKKEAKRKEEEEKKRKADEERRQKEDEEKKRKEEERRQKEEKRKPKKRKNIFDKFKDFFIDSEDKSQEI